MVKAKDLRVGNLILRKGKPFWVDIWTFVQIHQDIADRKNFLAECEGLPITPEILEKCGFDYNTKRDLWYNRIAVRHVLGGITYLYWECSDPYYDEDGVTITSVHQMQNLYFALTGEELTIKQNIAK